MISPVLIIFLLLLLGTMSYISLEDINDNLHGITGDLAPDAGTASEIMNQVYLKRLQVKEYIKRKSSTIEEFISVNQCWLGRNMEMEKLLNLLV